MVGHGASSAAKVLDRPLCQEAIVPCAIRIDDFDVEQFRASSKGTAVWIAQGHNKKRQDLYSGLYRRTSSSAKEPDSPFPVGCSCVGTYTHRNWFYQELLAEHRISTKSLERRRVCQTSFHTQLVKFHRVWAWVSNDQHPQELWCGDVDVDVIVKACLGR